MEKVRLHSKGRSNQLWHPMKGPSLLSSPLLALRKAKQAFLRTEKTEVLFRGSLETLLLRVLGAGIRVVIGIMLARMMGASAYGTYSYAVTWLAFLSLPAMLGQEQVLVRYVSIYKEARSWAALRGLLRFSLFLGLAGGLVVGLVSMGIVALLSGLAWDLRATMWITLALLPILVLSQMRQAALRGLDQPAIAQIPDTLVYPAFLLLFAGLAYLLAGQHLTAPGVAAASAGAWLVALSLGTIFLLRKLPQTLRTVGPAYEKSAWMKMVPPLLFVGVAYNLMSRADVFILGAISSSRDVGVYAAALRSAEIVLLIFSAITVAGASLFSSIYASGDIQELQRFARLLARAFLWATLPAYALMMVFAPFLLGLFGQEFVDGAAAMRVLLTAYFLSSLSGMDNVVMLYMTGHQKDVAVAMGVMAAVNIGLCFLLIPPLGTAGAALASGASILLLKGSLVVVLYKRVGIVSLPFSFRMKDKVGAGTAG